MALAFQVDSDVGVNQATTAGRVSSWNDQSGNGRNVGCASTAAEPVTGVHTSPSGLNVITFDGLGASGQRLGDYNQPNLSSVTGASTHFVVCKADADPCAVFDQSCPWSGMGYQTYLGGTDGLSQCDWGSTTYKSMGDLAGSFATWHVLSCVSDTNDFRFYIDGTLVYSTATNTVGGGSPSNWIGSNVSNASYKGRVAAVRVYDTALDTSARQAVESALNTKYLVAGGPSLITSSGFMA